MTQEQAICKTCNKEFLFYRSTLRGKDATFCSRACIRLIPHNKGRRDARVYTKCLTCNKDIETFKSMMQKYCSQKCVPAHPEFLGKYIKGLSGAENPFYGKKHSKETLAKISGENNFNWKGGITRTTFLERRKFNMTVGKMVFERDGYKCQMCGAGSELQVDHIQPWSEYVEQRFDMKNCRTLCRECHYFVSYGKKMPKGSKWGLYTSSNPFGKDGIVA